MANRKFGTMYVGVTNSLHRRVAEHKTGYGSKFVSQYKLHRCVYYETYGNIQEAIKREKQLKAGTRKQKIELIEKENLAWRDLCT